MQCFPAFSQLKVLRFSIWIFVWSFLRVKRNEYVYTWGSIFILFFSGRENLWPFQEKSGRHYGKHVMGAKKTSKQKRSPEKRVKKSDKKAINWARISGFCVRPRNINMYYMCILTVFWGSYIYAPYLLVGTGIELGDGEDSDRFAMSRKMFTRSISVSHGTQMFRTFV